MINKHLEAVYATAFYDGTVNKPPFQEKFYPKSLGETQISYKLKPKIAVPISSGIVNRIVGILCSNYTVETEGIENQAVLDLLLEQGLNEYVRDSIVTAIVSGASLTTYQPTEDTVKLQSWGLEYLNITPEYVSIIGVKDKHGVIRPVLDSADLKNKGLFEYVDPIATYTQNIDKVGLWPRSFIVRFQEMVEEFNGVVSQMSRSIRVLQNIWVTNLNAPNPDAPISMTPDVVNFLGENGTLEQVTRNLNLDEERNYLEILEQKISNASQVPAELSGLRDAGKIPSGVALTILLQPLRELMSRFEPVFRKMTIELCEKSVSQYKLYNNLSATPVPVVFTRTETALLPQTRAERLADIVTLKQHGLATDEQLKELTTEWLG